MTRAVRAVMLALALVSISPGAAVAAAPVATGDVEYQLWVEGRPGASVAIVSVSLPAETPLPATVRIPIPVGMTVDWAGEILGGDPANDVERPFRVKQGAGGSYAEFEVSGSREAQIDAAGDASQAAGSGLSAQFELVQSVPASATGVSVRMPSGVSDVKISPQPDGAPQVSAAGEALYALDTPTMSEGESLSVTVSYAKSAPATSGSAPAQAPLDGFIAILVVLLVVAVVALFVAADRSRRAQR